MYLLLSAKCCAIYIYILCLINSLPATLRYAYFNNVLGWERQGSKWLKLWLSDAISFVLFLIFLSCTIAPSNQNLLGTLLKWAKKQAYLVPEKWNSYFIGQKVMKTPDWWAACWCTGFIDQQTSSRLFLPLPTSSGFLLVFLCYSLPLASFSPALISQMI